MNTARTHPHQPPNHRSPSQTHPMPNAIPPPHPASQPRQGLGARIARRFGGAVQGVIAGITRRSQKPAPPSDPTSQPAQDKQAPAKPRQPSAPRRPHSAPPATPRPGWFARWFGRRPRQPEALDPGECTDTRFTPETCPGLSPEACALFNTPVEDLDSDTLQVLLAALVHMVAASLPAELGMQPQAVFDTYWERLRPEPEVTEPDAPPPEQPDPPPVPQDQAEPDVSPLQPVPAQRRKHAAATEPPVASATTPHPAGPAEPFSRPGRTRPDRGRWPRSRRSPALRRPFGRRRASGDAHHPPVRRLCYAACAGPP